MSNENKTKICKFCREEIDPKAKWCPHCGKDIRDWASRHPVALTVIIFVIFVYIIAKALPDVSRPESSSILNQKASVTSSQESSNPEKKYQGNVLELLDYGCYKEYDYFITEGQVKNISNDPIENVEAIVSAYTKDGKFVKSDSALIEYDPIMPGQISPFRVGMTDNPQIEKCKVEFKEFWGAEIPTKR